MESRCLHVWQRLQQATGQCLSIKYSRVLAGTMGRGCYVQLYAHQDHYLGACAQRFDTTTAMGNRWVYPKLQHTHRIAKVQKRPNVPSEINGLSDLVFWGLAGSCSELGLCGVFSLTQFVNFREMSYVGASSADMLCQLGGRSDRKRCTKNVKKE